MGKILLNDYKMNEAIAMLKAATESSDRRNFILKCDNCTLDIIAGGMIERGDEVIEIALFDTDGKTWLAIELDDGDDVFVLDRPIIHGLPLICFPAFARQFKALDVEDFGEIWDAWDTIACYM